MSMSEVQLTWQCKAEYVRNSSGNPQQVGGVNRNPCSAHSRATSYSVEKLGVGAPVILGAVSVCITPN